MPRSSTARVGWDSDSSFNSDYDPADEKFFNLDNIVECLFNTRLLNDIECRKILSQAPNVVNVRASIYEIMFTKDDKTLKKILQVLRNLVHPLQNPKILQRIFSCLNYADISTCKNVCPDWKQIINLLIGSNYDEVNLDHRLLMNLVSKNKKIQNTKTRHRKNTKNAKKAAAFQLMLAGNSVKDDTMLETLQIGKDIPPNVNDISINISFDTENNTDHLIAKVLSNPTVLSNIFQFLTLTDIKNCRTVCRNWNSVSESNLRKLSAIKFSSKFTPTNFFNVSKYLPLPNLQHTAFKFRDVSMTEDPSEFFTKYGENIRSLDLCLRRGIRTYLSYTCNLTELNFSGALANRYRFPSNYDPKNIIPWSSLHSIKILYLSNTSLEIDETQDWKRITPVKLHLYKVHFLFGNSYPGQITLNDYIDFTKVTDANLSCGIRQKQQFDLARDTFDADKIRFSNIELVNPGNSKSVVNYLQLNSRIRCYEKYSLSVKQLIVEDKSAISFEAIPNSIEKLALCSISREDSNIRTKRIDLPNLKYLSYRAGSAFKLLSVFDDCPNLTEMEIRGMKSGDFAGLPRSVKKLKVDSSWVYVNVFLGLTPEAKPFNLDLLILDFVWEYGFTELKFDRLRPKVLVIQIGGVYDEDRDENFISFVEQNKQIEKIYVQFGSSCQPSVFSQTQLSKIVDKQSECYVFSKECGKAIMPTEFVTIQNSLAMETVMKEFWSTQGEQQSKKHREDFYKRFQAYAQGRS